MDKLDKIVKALEVMSTKHDNNKDTSLQSGYVEGVCDSINLIVKLYYDL